MGYFFSHFSRSIIPTFIYPRAIYSGLVPNAELCSSERANISQHRFSCSSVIWAAGTDGDSLGDFTNVPIKALWRPESVVTWFFSAAPS